MNDLISRQKAIDFLGEEPEVWYGEPEEYAAREQWRADVSSIKAVPSAEQERGEAHWISAGWDGDFNWQIDGRGNCWRLWRCSHCFTESKKASRFCPECGFEMTEMPEVEE